MPGIADNALLKAARLLGRLERLRPEPVLVPEVEALLRTVTGRSPAPDTALDLARSFSPLAAALVEPLLALTVSPTMIRASQKRNVIPALCEVTVDCRLLPGQTTAEAERLGRDALGEGGYDPEWIQAQGGTRSPPQSTARARGPQPSAFPTAASRWRPRRNGSAPPTSSSRSCAARPGCSRRSPSCQSCGGGCRRRSSRSSGGRCWRRCSGAPSPCGRCA